MTVTSLIIELENALEDHWTAVANMETSDAEAVYMTAQELQEHGIGAVFIPTMTGRMAWLDLDSMEF